MSIGAKNTYFRVNCFAGMQMAIKSFSIYSDRCHSNVLSSRYKVIINVVSVSGSNITLYNYLLTKAHFHSITHIIACLKGGTGQTSFVVFVLICSMCVAQVNRPFREAMR